MDGVERCIDDEIPFEIPDSWEWVRLNGFAYITSGSQHVESESGYLYIKVADMNLLSNEKEITTSSHYTQDCPEGDIPNNSIIFPKRGGAIATNKRRKVLRKNICIDSNTMALTVYYPSCFEYLYLWFLTIDLGKLQTGTSVPQINNKDLEPKLIPVPPLAEQKRIVEKVYTVLTTYRRSK